LQIFAQKERREAFRREALPHIDSLYRIAVRSCADPALAQDLVQETFTEAWRTFQNYQPSTNCKAWLFKIFFRSAKRYQQKDRALKPVPLEDLPEQSFSVMPCFEERIKQRIILKVLQSLPDHYTSVLV